MPIPSGARYPGESESHRAARRAEAERAADAERAALTEATPKPRHRRPATRPAPTPPPKPKPEPEPTPEPAEPLRRTWRDLDATEINQFALAPDPLSYDGVHWRLRRERGPASAHRCVVPNCEREATAYAWQHTGPHRTGEKGGSPVTWGTDLDAYAPMCTRHHRMLDGGGTLTHCPSGHDRATAGEDAGGGCSECRRERVRRNQRARRATPEGRAAYDAYMRDWHQRNRATPTDNRF